MANVYMSTQGYWSINEGQLVQDIQVFLIEKSLVCAATCKNI